MTETNPILRPNRRIRSTFYSLTGRDIKEIHLNFRTISRSFVGLRSPSLLSYPNFTRLTDSRFILRNHDLLDRFLYALQNAWSAESNSLVCNQGDNLTIHLNSTPKVLRDALWTPRHRIVTSYVQERKIYRNEIPRSFSFRFNLKTARESFGPDFSEALEMLGRFETHYALYLIHKHRKQVNGITIAKSEITSREEIQQLLDALAQIDERAFDFAHYRTLISMHLHFDAYQFVYLPFLVSSIPDRFVETVTPPLPRPLWNLVRMA